MRLCLLAVGRLKDGPEQVLCERYAGRIADSGRNLGFSGPDLIEISESRSRRPEDRKADEAASLMARLPAGPVIVFDERGNVTGSEAFAGLLARHRDGGNRAVSLLIGGADGLDAPLREQASHCLSFGNFTIPHQLVRILVLEQVYRAVTILGGHPYHRV